MEEGIKIAGRGLIETINEHYKDKKYSYNSAFINGRELYFQMLGDYFEKPINKRETKEIEDDE